MRAGVIIALTAVLATSCTWISGPDGPVQVRLHNLSATPFDSVIVQFPHETRSYGAIAAGDVSAYATVAEAYRYAGVEAWVGDDRYVLQPTDYVGESPLPSGRHTYGLTFDGASRQLGIVMADTYSAEHSVLFLAAAQPASVSMEALFAGRVIIDHAGCIRLGSPDPATVIWPYGFSLVVRDGQRRVVDGEGREIGALGGSFRLGGGEVPQLSASILAGDDRTAAVARCPGRYWIVGQTG